MTDRSIQDIKLSIEQNPYIASNYDDLITSLKTVEDRLDRAKHIHEAYKDKLQYFRLKHNELNNWLLEIHAIDDVIERSSLEYEFYNSIVPDYSNADIMNNYLEFCKDLVSQEILDEDDYQNLFSKVLTVGAHDFINGNKIWINLLEFFKQKYLKSNDDGDLQALIKLHLKRLSYPHQQLESSFSEFSSLISEFDNENYDERMTVANKIYSKTKADLPYYESFEISIKRTPNEPQLWINYMEDVHKHNREDINAIIAIFERAIATDESWSNEWENVWMSVIYLIYSNEEIDFTSLNFILTKYIRTFPFSGHAFSETIRNCSTLDGEDVIENYQFIKHRIDLMKLMTKWGFQEWKLVVLAIIQMKYQRIKTNQGTQDELGEFVDDFIDEILQYAEQAMESNDIFHSVEKLAISVYSKLGDTSAVLRYLAMLYEKFHDQVDIWLFAVKCYVELDIQPSSIRSLFSKALSYATELDFPEKLTEEWLLYEQLSGDISTYEKAVVVCNESMKKVVQKLEQQQLKQEINGHQVQNKRKRKYEDIEKEPETKSREKCTVKVEGLSLEISEDQVRDFFKECGEIGAITFVDDDDDHRIAIFDFQNEQQVFTGLTKTHKKLQGNEILVSRLQDALLFVNNYPSTYSQDELKQLFSDIGKVASIRFPNQTSKRQKRFCYLQMISSDDAQKVINNYNGKIYHDDNLDGEFAWDVELSKPTIKHERTAPISERKIRVANIQMHISGDVVKERLAKCGEIESITFPRATYDETTNRVHKNGGLAIVVYKTLDGFENALKLNGVFLKGRKLVVSKQQRPTAIKPEDFDGVKTIGLCDLDASLNYLQVKKYFEVKFGKVSKVLLFPEDKQALVEFVDAADAGKVGLTDSLLEIGNSTAKVVTKEDITKRTSTSKQPVMPTLVPTSIRRRKLK